MIRWIASLAAILLGAAGCDSTVGPDQSHSPALWQIETAEGEVEGWLFGTIHALPDGTEWRTDAFENAFTRADTLVVEIEEFDNASLVQQLATTRGIGPLRQRISEDRRPTLREMMQQGGISEGQFVNIESWAAAMTIAQIGRDSEPGNGVDQALIADARQSSITVVELEGAIAQLRIFDGLAEQDQLELVHSAIDEYASPENEADELRTLWLSGNIMGLEGAIDESMGDTPGLYSALLTDRNYAMAAKAVQLLQSDEKPFVAVGAAHMVGPTGLPELLVAQGYTIRRLQ